MPDQEVSQSTSATPEAAQQQVAPPAFSWDGVQLSPESKQMLDARKWENPDKIIQSYANLEKLARVPESHLIRIPTTDDKAAWDAVYAKLGRPETADKYVIPLPEGNDGSFAGVAKGWFHDAGISQSAATKLSEKWNAYMAEQQTAMEQKTTEKNQTEINALKQSWGADYDKRAEIVDRAAESFGMTQEHLSALKTALGPKSAMEFLYNIGSKIAVEEKNTAGMAGETRHSMALTPEQAKDKLATLRADPSFAQLFTHSDPKTRMEAREQIARLTQIAYPGQTTL